MESTIVQEYMPYIVIVNFAAVGVTLIILGLFASRRRLEEVPGTVQNAAEAVLDWFVRQARSADPQGARRIAPFLATLFIFILFSNLLALLPIPIVKIPPTSFYSGPLALALCAVLGIIVYSFIYKGILGAIKHFVWPNPLQLISEFSHALSLSLRLFGNIGGEFIVIYLVIQTAPYGIPLIVHGLGLIPAFIQPLVFTLLTANFLAGSIHKEEKRRKKVVKKEVAAPEPAPLLEEAPIPPLAEPQPVADSE